MSKRRYVNLRVTVRRERQTTPCWTPAPPLSGTGWYTVIWIGGVSLLFSFDWQLLITYYLFKSVFPDVRFSVLDNFLDDLVHILNYYYFLFFCLSGKERNKKEQTFFFRFSYGSRNNLWVNFETVTKILKWLFFKTKINFVWLI